VAHHASAHVTPVATASPAPTPGAGGIANRVAAWDHGSGGADLHRVVRALGAVSRADASGGLHAVGTACAKIAAAVIAAQGAPQIPDPAAAKWYTRALAKFEQGATECQDGVSSDDAAIIERALAPINAGSADMVRATAAIKSLGAG
jgi:hypothetical protein